MIRLTAIALAALFATSAFASDAAGHDDVSFGAIPHTTFGVPLVQPDTSLAAAAYDDAPYAPAAEHAAPAKKQSTDSRVAERAACQCHAG